MVYVSVCIAEKEVVDILSLETFKTLVGKILDNLIYLCYYPCFEQKSGLIHRTTENAQLEGTHEDH